MRPLRGQREVHRRLQEQNTARRERINNVRQLGGLEPLPEQQEQRTPLTFESLHENIFRFRGRSNNEYTMREVSEHIRQLAAYSALNREAVFVSTQASPWSMSYIDTGEPILPRGRAVTWDSIPSYRPDDWEQREDMSLFFNGEITVDEYIRRRDARKIKKKSTEEVSNKQAKLLLEDEY